MRILAVQNPRSGQGDSGFPAFCDALRALGTELTVREVRKEVPLDELLRDADTFDRVVAAGGDGTVSGVAHVLAGTGQPILAYPAGTANLIALNLNVPSDPKALVRVALGGGMLRTDLGEIETITPGPPGESVDPRSEVPAPPERKTNKVGFALIAGAGFDAELIAGSEDLKARLGVGAYVASALAHARPKVARLKLTLDGREITTEGIGVMLMNFGRIQLDLQIAPSADAHDGLLEVVVLRSRSVAGLVPVLAGALAEKLGLRGPDLAGRLEVHKAREVRIEADPPMPLQFDGDVLEGTTPLTARVLPGAAVFLVPGDSGELEGHPAAVVEPGR